MLAGLKNFVSAERLPQMWRGSDFGERYVRIVAHKKVRQQVVRRR